MSRSFALALSITAGCSCPICPQLSIDNIDMAIFGPDIADMTAPARCKASVGVRSDQIYCIDWAELDSTSWTEGKNKAWDVSSNNFKHKPYEVPLSDMPSESGYIYTYTIPSPAVEYVIRVRPFLRDLQINADSRYFFSIYHSMGFAAVSARPTIGWHKYDTDDPIRPIANFNDFTRRPVQQTTELPPASLREDTELKITLSANGSSIGDDNYWFIYSIAIIRQNLP